MGAESDPTHVVGAFTDAVNRHDIAAMLALCAPDVVLETTAPPDGERLLGRDAVADFWKNLFQSTPGARVEVETVVAGPETCTVLLRYVFDAERPAAGHVRGVDVFRVVGGRIVEKLSYVKG